MLEHLRRHVIEAFEPVQAATLASAGPAGLLANVFPCRALGTRLYIQVPRTTDHLVNLDADPQVVATTSGWQARGRASVMAPSERPVGLSFASGDDLRWYSIVEVVPMRVEIAQPGGWGSVETIDIDEQSGSPTFG